MHARDPFSDKPRMPWRDTGAWAISAFVGLMFATAITGPIPAVADWQAGIVCGSGQSLSHEKYVTWEPGSIKGVNGATVSGGGGVGFTYRCVSPNGVSGSKTPIVLGLQFLAGTLVTFALFVAAAIRSRMRAARTERDAAPQG